MPIGSFTPLSSLSWPGLAPAAARDLRIAMLRSGLQLRRRLAALLPLFQCCRPAVLLDRGCLARLPQLLFLGVALASAGVDCDSFIHVAADPLASSAARSPASFYALAALTGIYGLINARIIRIRRIAVHLPNLPASWHGRKGRLAERPPPRHHQQRPFLPPSGCAGLHSSPRRYFSSRRPLRRHKRRSRQPRSRLSNQLTPPLRHLLLYRQPRGVHSPPRTTSTPSRAPASASSPMKVVIDGLRIAGVLYHDSFAAAHKAA